MGLIIGVGGTKPTFAYDYYYGIEWDSSVSNAKPKRIGKMELHKELPLQNLIRRCIQNDDGSVNYYLHANDSTKRDNGAAADLTGKDGMYMTELPDMYVRFEMDGNKCRHLQSTQPLPGFHLWQKDYISAVQATVQRSTGKLASVCSNDVDYRGGGNQAEWDSLPKTMLGKPATVISLTGFRQAARKRSATPEWNCSLYQTRRKLYWLFVTEYANFNVQDAFTAELDVNGFHQGGLGAGVTTIPSGKWSAFNGYYPLVPCGVTNSLGNHSGCVDYTLPDAYDSGVVTTVSVPSYRGVESIYGDLWEWTDGCKCLIQSDVAGGLSKFYVCDDMSKLAASGFDGYQYRGNIPRNEGYVKSLILGEDGEIMPLSVGAGSTTYFCDYYYTSIPATGEAERGVLFGGSAFGGAAAGFVFADANVSVAYTSAYFASRLCFYPNRKAAA